MRPIQLAIRVHYPPYPTYVKSMRRDMKKLVDTMEKSGEDVALVSSDVIAEEDYDAMRERLRAELMEELLNRDVEAQSREE